MPRQRTPPTTAAHNGGVTRHGGLRDGTPGNGTSGRGATRSNAPRFTALVFLALALTGCSLLRAGTPAAHPASTAAPSTAAHPASTAAPSTAAPSTAAPSTDPTPERHHYSAAALDYFSAIALSPEYGDGAGEIRKWTTDVRIAVHGDPTDEDLATLDDVVVDLNALIGPIEVEVVGSEANVDVYFAPEPEFSEIAPEYIPVNMGFFWTWWDGGGSITRARILVSTTGITQTERDHIIREEVTQSLGLMNDSYSHEDSMFYQGWTSPTKYSALDESLIEMLYLPEITPGMSAADALAVLRGE